MNVYLICKGNEYLEDFDVQTFEDHKKECYNLVWTKEKDRAYQFPNLALAYQFKELLPFGFYDTQVISLENVS